MIGVPTACKVSVFKLKFLIWLAKFVSHAVLVCGQIKGSYMPCYIIITIVVN